jgi:TonB family protein
MMLAYPTHRARRCIVLILILAVHGIVIWLLAHSVLVNTAARPPRIISSVIQLRERRLADRPPPALRTEVGIVQSAPAQVPMPLVHIERPADPTLSAGLGAGTNPGAVGEGRAAPIHQDPKLMSAPKTASFYPLASLEYHEQGAVIVSVCLSAQDQITGVELLRASRFPRLNAAAMRVAYKTRWSAALLGSTPIAECAPFEVDFIDVDAPLSRQYYLLKTGR